MCFAPQRRALFRHLNFQKWSEREVPLAFSLPNVPRDKTACTSSTSRLLKVLPKLRCFVHYGMQFSISHLASWLRTRRFSEPTFTTLRSLKSLEKHGKTQSFATFLPFGRAWIFFLLTLSLSSSLLFSSLTLPSLLFICLYCRKFDF